MIFRIVIAVVFITAVVSNCRAQDSPDRQGIEKAKKALEDELATFTSCTPDSDLKTCIATLASSAHNEYEKYIVGGLLFNIDQNLSLQLHREAYEANPKNIYFNLEYAIELHRAGKYADAIPLYEKCQKAMSEDYRLFVWLSECYVNLGKMDLAVENWKKSNHHDHHTGIDFAIHIIHGKTDQFAKRDQYRMEIATGNLKNAYQLIFMDINWVYDWWNGDVNKEFLRADLALLEGKFKDDDLDYKTVKVYEKIKVGHITARDSIEMLLKESKILLGDSPLPRCGQITSELLNICLQSGLLQEKQFYDTRGEELLKLARDSNDKDLLNIYAYLQAVVNGKVDPEIDKMGWAEFRDERFAISYFIGKGASITVEDPELARAIIDFPDSPQLFWFRAKAARVQGLPVKDLLAELIKREFRTLGSDPSRYSNRLNGYFRTWEQEKN